MILKKYKFKSLNSTNNTALTYVKRGYKNGIIISEIQRKGKGQRSKVWISNKGNLLISVFFKINKELKIKNIINLVLKIIKKIISKNIKEKITIKKPNDILIKNKKVCGILQEILYKNKDKYLIIGIGINIINSPKLLNYPTTYLNRHSTFKINKDKLINQIKINFEKNYKLFSI